MTYDVTISAPTPITEDELVVNLTSGATKLAVTPNEAKEIMAFIR